jgi:hypothetical protein
MNAKENGWGYFWLKVAVKDVLSYQPPRSELV